jgi:hypothetical protein
MLRSNERLKLSFRDYLGLATKGTKERPTDSSSIVVSYRYSSLY